MIKKIFACTFCITHLYTMDPIMKVAVLYRMELILRKSRINLAQLPPAQCGRYVFGHPKAIRHYLLTGKTIEETHSDELISDEQFIREFTQTEIALSEKFAKRPPEEQQQLAMRILSDYHAKIEQKFVTFSIISELLNGQKNATDDEDI